VSDQGFIGETEASSGAVISQLSVSSIDGRRVVVKTKNGRVIRRTDLCVIFEV
jgi:hypothetical protein